MLFRPFTVFTLAALVVHALPNLQPEGLGKLEPEGSPLEIPKVGSQEIHSIGAGPAIVPSPFQATRRPDDNGNTQSIFQSKRQALAVEVPSGVAKSPRLEARQKENGWGARGHSKRSMVDTDIRELLALPAETMGEIHDDPSFMEVTSSLDGHSLRIDTQKRRRHNGKRVYPSHDYKMPGPADGTAQGPSTQ